MIGVNTDPLRSGGYLWDYKIKADTQVEDLDDLILSLKNIDRCHFNYRSRLNLSVIRCHQVIKRGLSLNEIVLEEAFGAKTCIYDLSVDGKDLGMLRSSGLIVATGSGSTGLLLSARRPRIAELSYLSSKTEQEQI
jgi:NAD kinase